MALYLGDSNKKINIGTTLWNAKVKIPHFDVLDNELPISWSQSVVSNNYANFTVDGITYRHISNLVLSAEDMALLNLDVTFTALETGATVTESLTIDSSNVIVNEFGYVCVFGNAISLLSATTSIDYGDFAIEKAGLYYAWISDVTTIADDFTFNLYMRPVVKIYSGDGYNLMNGSTIVLPEWDKTTYPYALITRTTLTGYGTYYFFFASSTPRYKHYKNINCLTIIESQNYASCTTEFGEKEWLEFKFGTSTFIGDTYQSFSSIIWSNYDIYQLVESETGTELINGAIVSVSDTIAYPKSDITDLDNTMIVEWDEAVTDLTSYDLATDSSGAFYKVADTILSSTNFSGGYYITGDIEAVQITDEMIVSSDGVVGVDGAVLCVTTAGAVYGDKTFPEAGLYMATKDVIKMFVYNTKVVVYDDEYPICFNTETIRNSANHYYQILEMDEDVEVGRMYKISNYPITQADLVFLDEQKMTYNGVDYMLMPASAYDLGYGTMWYLLCMDITTDSYYLGQMLSVFTANDMFEVGTYFILMDADTNPVKINADFVLNLVYPHKGWITVTADSAVEEGSVTHIIEETGEYTMLKVSDTIMTAADINASVMQITNEDGTENSAFEIGKLLNVASDNYTKIAEIDGGISFISSNYTKIASISDAETSGYPETGTYVVLPKRGSVTYALYKIYGDSELPVLPEYDKTSTPYLTIAKVLVASSLGEQYTGTIYAAYLAPTATTCNVDNNIIIPSGATTVAVTDDESLSADWQINMIHSGWGRLGYTSSDVNASDGLEILWTNHDVLDTDGNIIISDSEPNSNLAADSWETISAFSKTGTPEYYYAVGDEKEVTLTTGEVITLQILGFNHDILSDGSGTAGITFGMKNVLATEYTMNSTSTNAGGWADSSMRTRLQPDGEIYATLPDDVKAVIRPVNKLTSAGSASTDINTTSDYAFLLSNVEIYGTTGDSVAGEGSRYDYYASIANTSAEKIKYLSDGTTKSAWWERSPVEDTSTGFCFVGTSGDAGTFSATSSCSVAFGFCV